MIGTLAASYDHCRDLHREHGRSYYLATRLLPRWKRRHVHALYGFTRYTDDIVDTPAGGCATGGNETASIPARGATDNEYAASRATDSRATDNEYAASRAADHRATDSRATDNVYATGGDAGGGNAAGWDSARRAAQLQRWADAFRAALRAGPDAAPPYDPILPAVLHTIATFRLDPADFETFLRSMEMDLTIGEYETYDNLLEYMAGSAAAIGSMMLPILGATDLERAREPARQLGLAFQLTNFIRDVGEDLDRNRIYLPIKDLARFGVTREDLRARVATEPIRRLISFEVDRARAHYARAAAGIPLLDTGSQPCIRAAFRLYGAILGEVTRARFDVFSVRATVPTRRRMALAARCLLAPSGSPEPEDPCAR